MSARAETTIRVRLVDSDLYRVLRGAVTGSLARNVAATLAVRVAVIGMGVVLAVLVARTIGPAAWGQYAIASAIAALGVQLASIGLQSSNTYFVSRDSRVASALVANSIVIAGVAGACAGLLLVIVLVFRGDWLPLPISLLTLALLSIPIGLLYTLLQGLTVGVHAIGAYNRIELGSRLGILLVAVALILLGRAGAASIFAAGVFGSAAAALASLRSLRPHIQRISPSLHQLRAGLAYGARAYLATFFAFSLLRADLLVVKYVLGAEQAGYYSIAASMADLVYLVPTVVGMLLFPRLTAISDLNERWRIARSATMAVSALLLVIAAMATLLAKPVVQLMFGAVYLPAVVPFVVLAAAMIFYGANNIVSYYLASIGFPWISVWVWVVASAANLGLNLVLIPKYGLAGAAAASLLCYAGVLVVQYAYATEQLRR